jgi:hypothetical protein
MSQQPEWLEAVRTANMDAAVPDQEAAAPLRFSMSSHVTHFSEDGRRRHMYFMSSKLSQQYPSADAFVGAMAEREILWAGR